MKLEELLKDYNHSPLTLKVNYLLIPVTLLKPTEDNAEIFNQLLLLCKNEIRTKFKRTKSGGISIKHLRLPAYDYTYASSAVELIIATIDGFYRIQFRSKLYENENTEQVLSGHKAFLKLKEHLKKFQINLDNYAVENGEEINSQTEQYIISEERKSSLNLTFNNVHHLDFHSSFPAGLVNTHPEFKNAINDLYIRRKTDPVCKAILNYSIGYLHSKYINYKYSILSRDAINDNNKRIREMREKLINSGRIPLLYNTDGIWYTGEIYHDENEGPNLGQWENDHINCKFRAKSKGAYEFIENDQYYPVIRGRTYLDREKDRKDWAWGDIYQADIIIFYATEDGIKYRRDVKNG